MLGTRHEEYVHFSDGLPFLLHADITRSSINYSKERNWHENLEIQLCDEGSGYALLDAERYEIEKNDIVVANSDVIHYTGTDSDMRYSCLIISTEFCKNVGFDPKSVFFAPIVKSPTVTRLFLALKSLYTDHALPLRTARLNKLLLELLIELAEHHGMPSTRPSSANAKNGIIKSVITYTRQNYSRKITLDEISKAVLYDKYALCREFKKYTGQTIMDDLNRYRCIKATELLGEGYSVAEAASLCGFDNLSYFGRVFKRNMGRSPSECKKKA